MFFSTASAAVPNVEIIEIDTYTKDINPGDTATYNWTVCNVNPQDITYFLNVTVTYSDTAWKVDISPSETVELKPRSALPVRLTVKSPSDIETGSLNATVIISVFQDNALIAIKKQYTITNIIVPTPPTEKKVLGIFPNPLPKPLDNEFGVFLLDILIWLGIASLIVTLLDPVIKRFAAKTKTQLDDIILAIIRTPILVLLFLFGFVTSLDALDKHIPEYLLAWSMQIYQIVLILVLFYVGYKLFKDILIYYGKKIAAKTATKLDDILIPVVEKVGVVIIGFVALGYLLGYLNIDLTMFIAGGVVISMVIAFAAQETLSNFFSGIFLLLDRPFQEGDIVILSDGDWCEVRKIGLRTTRLFRFADASMVSIPNNKLVNEKISNFTGPADKGRVMMTFNVAYGSDPEKVKNAIRRVIDKCEPIVKDDPNLKPIVRFEEMADSSINFFVLVWIKDRGDRFYVKDFLNTHVYNEFNREGIEIPFPQRVVHIRQEVSEKKS
jgi:small-conductance mechanosensitive channel